MKFQDLLIEHDYYCADTNFYDSDVDAEWDSFQDFLDVYDNLNMDQNLVFRWDLHKNENETYYLEIFMVFQRKGFFVPHIINNITESDFDKIRQFLQPRFEKLFKLWLPFKQTFDLK